MYTMVVIATLGFLLTLPPMAWPQMTKNYTIKQVTYQGSVVTTLFGINDRPGVYGDVVGAGSGDYFVKMGGRYVNLALDCGPESINGLNNNRVVVGNECGGDFGGAGPVGFTITGAGRRETRIDFVFFPGSSDTFAFGINDAGSVAGAWNNGVDIYAGFILQDGVYTSLPILEGWDVSARDVNNRDQIVGTAYEWGTGITYGFLFEDGEYQFFQPPESTYFWVVGMNDHGHIVGNYWVDEPSEVHENCCWKGFLFKHSTFTTLNVIQTAQTRVAGINNDGQIAGTFYRQNGGGSPRGFVAIPKPKKVAKVATR